MNYLAHALLSPHDPMYLMGNLWGDLIRPRDYVSLHPDVLEGVRLHKKIDAFTDQHHAVEQMTRLLRPHQGKYTPVVADVLMDYMLSTYWSVYHHESIEAFCQLRYVQVKKHLDVIPDRLHPRIGRMLEHQWLESCHGRERMEHTLLMLSRRAAFENQIPHALIAYDAHRDQMDELFRTFFEDVRRWVTLQNGG